VKGRLSLATSAGNITRANVVGAMFTTVSDPIAVSSCADGVARLTPGISIPATKRFAKLAGS